MVAAPPPVVVAAQAAVLSKTFDTWRTFVEETFLKEGVGAASAAVPHVLDGFRTILDRVRDYAMEIMRRSFSDKLRFVSILAARLLLRAVVMDVPSSGFT